jgi:hypothetical protein
LRPERPVNAYIPIEVTFFGVMYSVRPANAKELRTPSTTRHLPSSDANLPLNSERFVQHANADSPI